MGFRYHLVKYFEIKLLLVKHLKKFTVQKFWRKMFKYSYSVNLLTHSATIYICMTRASLVNFQPIYSLYPFFLMQSIPEKGNEPPDSEVDLNCGIREVCGLILLAVTRIIYLPLKVYKPERNFLEVHLVNV